jgi:hypothetical protein
MFPKELGSKTLQHNTLDPQCVHHELANLKSDEAARCELCEGRDVREQAQAAFNLRELGS